MAVVIGRRVDVSSTPKWWLWGALFASALTLAAIAIIFAWPSGEPGNGVFQLGSVDDFSVRSVTTVEEGEFHLVRLDDGTFIALSSVDPHLGCTVPWRANFVWGPDGGQRGWFRNGCHGETYDITGRRVFGPSPRDLDRYPVSVVSGRVTVDTSRYLCGYAPPGADCVQPSPQP